MKDYENKELLKELYIDKEMSQREVANELGCSARTIGRKLEKYDIESRGFGGAGNARAAYIHDPRGYTKAQCGDDNLSIYIHQLVAISDGTSPYKVFDDETEVHHKNGIKWDNRPNNVEVKNRMEHQAEHIGDNWTGVSIVGI